MSLVDQVLGRKCTIPRNAMFRLTQSGAEKLADSDGTPKYRVMVALETRGTSTVDEIADTSRMSRGSVERTIPVLISQGYVQRTNPAAEGGSE